MSKLDRVLWENNGRKCTSGERIPFFRIVFNYRCGCQRSINFLSIHRSIKRDERSPRNRSKTAREKSSEKKMQSEIVSHTEYGARARIRKFNFFYKHFILLLYIKLCTAWIDFRSAIYSTETKVTLCFVDQKMKRWAFVRERNFISDTKRGSEIN